MANGDKTILYVDKVAIDNYIAQGQYVFNTGVYKSVLFAGTTRYDAIVQDENTIISSSSDWYSCFNTGISISDSTEVVQINSKDYYKLDSYIRTTGYTYSSGQKLFFAIGGDTMSSYVLAENEFEQTIVEFDYDLNKVTPDYFLWDVTNGVESLKVLYTEPPHKIISEIQYPDETIYDIKDKNALNKSQITNCLLEVPQRIKLELNDGTLTLKAGSVVIVPNGFETDGTTPKFDYVVISEDKSQKTTYNAKCLCFCNIDAQLANHGGNICFSGSTQPTSGQVWYNTTSNKILVSGDNGQTWAETKYSLPIAVTVATTNGITSIDQVFNGFGYIGSTIWIDKGVKGLIPNGRNEDGTLRNIEYTNNKIMIPTFTGGYADTFYLRLSSTGTLPNHSTQIRYDIKSFSDAPIPTVGKWYSIYVEDENMFYYSDNGGAYNKDSTMDLGIYSTSANNKITSLNPKLPFRAVDYNDKSEISDWGMPSNKYIDLTLGASGSTYTAPANGWFQIDKITGISGFAYLVLRNNTSGICNNPSAYNFNSGTLSAFVPAIKGDNIRVSYNATGNTTLFRFIYAQGEV